MGYPKHYVGRWPTLAKWLISIGHTVYPMEMFCQPVHIETGDPVLCWDEAYGREYFARFLYDEYGQDTTHDLYGAVDVISMSGGKLYGWEYKSKGDDATRAIKQLENYARSFNYVCLAMQDITPLNRLIRKQGMYLKTILQRMSAGVYYEQGDKFGVLYPPVEQAPIPKLNEDLINRFRRNTSDKPTPKQDGSQRRLVAWQVF
jgi:hypothetical protein